MLLTICKSKIHRATVTQADLDYVGSLTIDETLMKAAGLREYERISVANISNGNRFDTYVIKGRPDSGEMCVNGAAAHLAKEGDLIIVIAYAQMTPDEADTFKPKLVFVDEKNRPVALNKEVAGQRYPATA